MSLICQLVTIKKKFKKTAIIVKSGRIILYPTKDS